MQILFCSYSAVIALGILLFMPSASAELPSQSSMYQLQILGSNIEVLIASMRNHLQNLNRILTNSRTDAERQDIMTSIGEIELQIDFLLREKIKFEQNIRGLNTIR
jgi:hypothetical protein